MNAIIEQGQYQKSFSRPEVPPSGALAENALFIMQSDSNWMEAIDELLAIRNYEDDFDGEGSIAPPVQIVDTALTFSNQLGKNKIPSPDRVTATFNQTVVFEWNFPNFYHSLEFISPTMAEAIWIPKDATEALIKKVHI